MKSENKEVVGWLRTTKIATLTLCLTLASLAPSVASPPLSKLDSASCASVDTGNGWVGRENLKKGDYNWKDLVRSPKSGKVSGWFDQTSAICGDTVGVHLSGNNRPVTIKFYRMGYYNRATARLTYSTTTGKVAPASSPIIANDPTHLTTTNWPTTTVIHLDPSFPPGIYMARFDDGGTAGYAPLVVRSATPTSGLLIVAGDLTWEAYNTWGGWSLYHGPDTSIYSPGRTVSFNRPYDRDGKSNFTIYDAGIVQTAESLGINASYTDDVYISSNPTSLLSATSVIYNGHSEYWTPNMYNGAFTARDAGVNLIFFGANDAYWRVRLESDSRNITVWKGSPDDPYANNQALVTNKWGQDPTTPNNSTLLGALYAGMLPSPVSYTVQDAGAWPIVGTGLKTGDKIAGVVGKEIETTDLGEAPAVQSFLTAKVAPAEPGSHKDVTVGMTYYTVPSKSGVLNVGTMGWVCSITSTCPWVNTTNSKTSTLVTAITKNILLAAAAGPLALTHPAVANIPARNTRVLNLH